MNHQACATCNGFVLNKSGEWVKQRTTIGMVCPDCGHDYAKGPKIQRYTIHHVDHFTKPHVTAPIEPITLHLIAIDKREVFCPDCYIYMIQERKRRWFLSNWIRIKRKR